MEILTHPLVLPVAVPLAAGVLCLLGPRAFDRARAVFTAAVAAGTVLLVLPLVHYMHAAVAPKPPALVLEGACYMRMDNLSALVLLGTAVFAFLIAVYSMGAMRGRPRLGEYCAYLLWTLAFSCGAVLANDLVLLLVFWGLLGYTLYMMVGIAGPGASAAAKKSFILIGGSDCLLMLGIAILWTLEDTTQMHLLKELPVTSGAAGAAFLCFVAAALAKAGAMPLHTWVPDCGDKAPVAVAAYLPASLDKLLGIYLLARATTGIFQMDTVTNTLLMIVGAGTIICGVMMALVQHDLKRLLSYHAVSQVGYMVLGIGTGTVVGIAGAFFHMLNNAIYKSCLFLCAGAVEKRTGTTELGRLGGLARTMPLTFASCLVAALAISGIPPLNGFTSKWMVYQGIVESGRAGGHGWVIWLSAAMLGSALTLASFVKVLHAGFLCKPSPDTAKKDVREVGFAMWLPALFLALLCIVLGVAAGPLALRGLIFPAVKAVTGQAVRFSGAWQAGAATVMLVAGYALGLLVYYLTTTGRARECRTYIGGEIMDEVFVGPAPAAKAEDVEVTGVDFYRTVESLPPFRGLYAQARRKLFDVYEVGTKAIFYLVEALRAAHTGRLPAYLTWVVVGLLAVLWALGYGGAAQ
jgi:formate hydrogenlyase subunit 3/multisubunit Na+/H+ antiporter MnhD subunit